MSTSTDRKRAAASLTALTAAVAEGRLTAPTRLLDALHGATVALVASLPAPRSRRSSS